MESLQIVFTSLGLALAAIIIKIRILKTKRLAKLMNNNKENPKFNSFFVSLKRFYNK